MSGYDTTMFWVNPTEGGATINVDNTLDIATEDGIPIGTNSDNYGSPTANGYLDSYLLGDGEAPNGILSGFGTAFPLSPSKGEFFKRTDFLPARLFRYDGFKWVFFENAARTNITNNDTRETLKGTFINNSKVTQTNSGNINEKQTLNDLLRPKAD